MCVCVCVCVCGGGDNSVLEHHQCVVAMDTYLTGVEDKLCTPSETLCDNHQILQ